MYLVKSPFWLQWYYPSLTWHKSRKDKCIYLTFDDGPIPVVTPWVLKTLKEFNAKATFFCIGDNVRKHPDVYKQVLADGHSVGNHTFNHLNGWQTKNAIYLENIARCAELVKSNLFRPPYGRIKKSQISMLKPPASNLKPSTLNLQPPASIIMWDVLSGDFDTGITPEKCLQNAVQNTQNGSIIVFHDSLKAFPRLQYALPKALKSWKENGYSFKNL